MTIHRTILLALAAIAPVTGWSDDVGYYAGLGVGGMRLEADSDITVSAYEYVNGQLTLIDSNDFGKFDGTDIAFRAFGGVRLGPYLAIEAGYVNLGEPEDSAGLNIPQFPAAPAQPQRPETDVQIKQIYEIDGWDVYVLGALPFAERWEAFAKLGMIKWDATIKVKNYFADTFPPSGPDAPFPAIPTVTPPSSTEDSDGVDLAGALGFDYKATERLSLRGEGTWYDIEDTDKVWMLGFSAIVSF